MTKDLSAPPMDLKPLSDSGEPPAEHATASTNPETNPAISKPFTFGANAPFLGNTTELPSTTSVPAYDNGGIRADPERSRDTPDPIVCPIGEARRKKHLHALNILAVAGALLCFVIAIVTLAPFSAVL